MAQQAEALVENCISICEEANKQILKDVTKLLSIISKQDALLIFSIAKDGMESSSMNYNKMGLTRKQYYTRLMQLKREGLIERNGNFYYHTTLGTFIYENCVNMLLAAIRNRKYMAMVDVLKHSNYFSQDATLTKNVINNIVRQI